MSKMNEEAMERTIERIRKMMTLALSAPDTEEGKNASDMAAKLLAKYDLAMSDLTEETKFDATEDFVPYRGGGDRRWCDALVATIAYAFDCKAVVHSDKYSFIGMKQDVVFATWLLKTLRRSISKRSEEAFPSTKKEKQRGMFKYGCVVSISKRLSDMKRKREEQASSCSSLVLRKEDAVDLYLKNKYPDTRRHDIQKEVATSPEDVKAYINGVEVGKELSLAQPVE